MTTPLKERQFESDERVKIPGAFIWRRLHSLLGLWLVIYLCEHLLVNSQAALFFHDDGYGFVTAVNKLEALPYLRVIELVFLGLPFLLHGLWGMYYAWTAKPNAHYSDGSEPELPQYKRNRAYSWERITAWLLVVGIVAHVVHMRFWSYPAFVEHGDIRYYMVRVDPDRGLPLVAEKLHAQILTADDISKRKEAIEKDEQKLRELEKEPSSEAYVNQLNHVLNERAWQKAVASKKLRKGEVLVSSPSAGGAFFLLLRQTFKDPLWVVLYSLLVIAAVFHAFNGLWTLLITWGVTLTRRSQKRARTFTNFFMGLVMLLGLMAAWGVYWTVQFQT